MTRRQLPQYIEPISSAGAIERTIDDLTQRRDALRRVRADLAIEIDVITQQLDRECYLLELARGPVAQTVHNR